MKLAACVILYHPDESLLNNLMSYLGYVEKLWLVDNSGEPSAIVNELPADPRIVYTCLEKNFGIAYALNHACELALSEGFDRILTMDQDSSIDSAYFFSLQHPGEDTAAIYSASFAGTKNRWIRPFNKDFDEIHFTITSGSVLSLKAWKAVGGFDTGLFIDEVDHDMCMKVRNKGWKILTSRRACLAHTVGIPVAAGGEAGHRFRPQPFRAYYHVRNSLAMVQRYMTSQPRFAFNRMFNLVKTVYRIIAYYPDKKIYFGYARRGMIDFFYRRKGMLKEQFRTD